MDVGERIIHNDTFFIGLAAYLFGYAWVLGIREHRKGTSLFFATSCLLLSLMLSYGSVHAERLLYEVAALCLWPSLYVSMHLHRAIRVKVVSMVMHFCLPVGWATVVALPNFSVIEGVFDVLYLLSTIGYGWGSIYETSLLQKNSDWKKGYRKVLFIGISLVIALRCMLPIFSQEVASYLLVFHVLTGVYFMVLSSFYQQAPLLHAHEQENAIQKEEALNYEEAVKRKLNKVMLAEKAFLNPSLTLYDLSQSIGIKPTELSQFVNNGLGKNFNDFVNAYRIEEVKRLMESTAADPHITIMELAYRAGFNSKASFNRIFKQFTQMTPTQFRKSMQQPH